MALREQPPPSSAAADNETGRPSRVLARGCALLPDPSSLLFLRLLKHRPCSQHATNSMNHSAPSALLSHAARAAGRRERDNRGAGNQSVAWGTTAGRQGRSQRHVGRPSTEHTRGCVPPPLWPSSLLFLRLLKHRPCSQHATNSMNHSAPWHCSPTLRGQLDGESELNRGRRPRAVAVGGEAVRPWPMSFSYGRGRRGR